MKMKQVLAAVKTAQEEYLAIPLKHYPGFAKKRRHRNSRRVVEKKLTEALTAAGMPRNEAINMALDIDSKFTEE